MSSSPGSSDRDTHVAAQGRESEEQSAAIVKAGYDAEDYPEPRTLRDEVEFAIGALRSNQDVLMHKVERSNVVREQLAINRNAIRHLQEALSRV